MTLPTTILVATDFSPGADEALSYAVELGAKLGAKLHLVNAIAVPALGVPEVGLAVASTLMESMVQTNQTELDKRAARHPSAHIATLLRTGDARDVILDVAREISADLIVVGTHGRRGFRRALIGSIAESVLRTARCPILAIREHRSEDADAARDAADRDGSAQPARS